MAIDSCKTSEVVRMFFIKVLTFLATMVVHFPFQLNTGSAGKEESKMVS